VSATPDNHSSHPLSGIDELHYENNHLVLEDVSLSRIADDVGTPTYCYSTAILRKNFLEFERACHKTSPLICFAVKANSNLSVLRLLASMGSGADVVSEGELRKALLAGIPANRIVFAGVGKKASEIRHAIEVGILQFNVESEAELELISVEAGRLGKSVGVALRVNPDVDAQTNAKITTGTKSSKFGIPISRAAVLYTRVCSDNLLEPRGFSVHIGSQLTTLKPFRHAFTQLVTLVREIREEGMAVPSLDLGGGLGVAYDDEAIPAFEDYGELVHSVTGELDCQIILEPGRSLVAQAGILLSEVILRKTQEERSFIVLDAAFNDLLRPGLYDAYHKIIPVSHSDQDTGYHHFDFVGPVCETSDTFCQNEQSADLATGDLVAILTAGAYGAVMASTYNTRPLVPEVLVDGDRFAVVRRRESYEEMFSRDQLPDWMDDPRQA